MALPEARLKEIEARFEQVEQQLSEPSVRREELRTLGKEHADLREVVEDWRAYRRAEGDLLEARALVVETAGDERAYLENEITTLQSTLERLEHKILAALIPKDPNDERDVIVEIRAGAGGDEAGLFAADLFRMYSRYAESKGWRTEVLSSNATGINGFKEVTFAVKGPGAYSRLKHEAGVHR